MISVGSRDARKGPGLGFGVSAMGREMEDTELEEGEACFYQNDEDYDENIDPDTDLSYIDEKLQNVLGQFQKDFEGGVSAENLGAKYGGYGSFLPAYQRSPVYSHQKTPPKIQNYSSPRSPNNLQMEGGHYNSLVSSTAPHSVGRGPASTSSTSLPALKASSASEPGKQEMSMPANRAEEIAPRPYPFNKQPTHTSDQKTLKVRLKVGSDNLPPRKNEELYCGLGLDNSPSSSLDDSPSESEGMSHEPPDALFESPTSILQIMTSFPVHGGLLLSPLPDDLIRLIEKEKLPKEGRSRGGSGTSGLVNGFDTKKGDKKVFEEKKMESVERNDCSAESKSGNNKDARNGIGVSSRKEPDLDSLACEELVSTTLMLPILSNSYSTSVNTTKSREVNKSILKDKALSDEAEDKQMESILIQEDGWVGKKKASSAGNGLGDGKGNFIYDISVHSHKEGHQKGEKTCDFVKSESNVNKGRKALNTEGIDSFKQNASMKDKSHEQESKRLLLGKEHPRHGKKKKSKASRGAMAAMLPEESLATGSSKVIKNTNMGNHMSSNNAENIKSHKDIGKNTDTYRDFFGELEEDNLVDSVEIPFEDKTKDANVFAKNEPAINGASKERPCGRKIDRPSTSETVLVTASSPRSGKGPVSDAAPPTGDPADNWVECVACRQWRLLPSNVDPEQLPDNWLCSMQVWLPGMDRCGFTEEETKEAFLALRQSQSHLSNPGAFSSEATANFRHPDPGLRTPGSGKKKHGLKVTSSAMNKDGPIQLPNYTKKNMQASMKSRSLNDVNNSPDFQQLSKSNDFSMEKEKHKHKERNKEFEPHNFGGDTKTLKMKRGVSEQDSSRASKKHKIDGKNLIDDGWASDHGRAVGKVGPSSSNGFPTSGKNFTKCSARSSKDSKVDLKNSEIRENVKKRKTKELQNGSFPGTGQQFHDTEEFSENEYKKEKKPRISRSDGKESSANKGNSRTDKKSRHKRTPLLGQDLGINPSQQSLDGGIDPLKRDFGPLQASFAATSSSSKVSGSHKTKSSFQEVKGSPVESVSSSPMRISNPDKFTSGRDLSVKDEFQDVGPFAVSSPKRSSDGDNLGEGDLTRKERKDKTYNVANRGSLESFAHNSQDRDFNHVSGSKARRQVAHSPDVAIHHSVNGSLADFSQNTQYPSKPLAPEHSGEEKHNESHHSANGSYPRKSGKGSTSRMEKNRSFKSDFDLVKVKNSDAVIELQNCSPSVDVKSRDGKNKLQEKLGVKSDEIGEKADSKRDVRGTLSGESSKRDRQLSIGGRDGPALEADAICRKDALSTPKQNLIQDWNDERPSKREMSVPLLPSGGLPSDTLNRCPRPGAGSNKGNGSYQVDAFEGDNAVKEQKQIRKADNQSRSQQINSRHPAKGGHRTRDLDAPSPARKDSSSHAAANAIKEAKDLKHLADRLKNSSSSHERRGLYFQSALKFLHGASLWESSYNEASKASDMAHSTKIYCDTAKLCEFCAHEYEKSKDMAGAALAYKCMEVAYMKVIYSSSGNAIRDRHELQTAPPMVPLGESPSSSASDVDNLNNPSTVEKVALPKGVSSPQVATNLVIAAQNRSNYERLLSFVQDVNYAMEASRKSRVAFAAANISMGMGESKYKEVIDSIKKALDFNFQDVEGLLRLVRLAMEGIGR